MTAYPAPLHEDSDETKTAAQWDAVNGRWFFYTQEAPATTAAAITKAEDTPHVTGDAGVQMLAVRQDTLAVLAANGDYIPVVVDATGKLWVSGTQLEDAVAGTGDPGHFALAIRRDTPTSDAAAGDYHGLHVDALGRLRVTGTQLEDAVAGDGDSGHFMLAVRRDAATSDAAAGDYHGLHVDALGRLRTCDRSDEDASNARTTALAASLVVKATPGKLFGFQGYSTTIGFIQVHNTTSVPADATVPVEVIPIGANLPFSFDGGKKGIAFSTGITVVFSTTGPTKTIGGSAIWVSAQYE